MPSIDMKILGDLPVTIEYEIALAETDVEIMRRYIDWWNISHVAGRKVNKAEWIYDKIYKLNIDQDICEQIMKEIEND